MNKIGKIVLTLLAFSIVIISTLWAIDITSIFDIALYQQQFLAAALGISIGIAFLKNPGILKKKRNPDLFDYILALTGISVSLYISVNYPQLLNELYSSPLDAILPGAILVVLVLEGLRRSTGNILPIVSVGFILFGLFGQYIPGELQGRVVNLSRMFVYLGLDSNGILGMPLSVGTTIVVPFVLMGILLQASGGSNFFTDIAMALMGRYRGGSAKIAITASALFGSISGSAVSNVTSVGMITIPLMKRGGYPDYMAGAIEAVSSTGGQLLPPVMGAAAFLMAEFLQIPYTKVALAAFIPALLYYGALFIAVDLMAARQGIMPVPKAQRPSVLNTFKAGWQFLVPFAILIYALFVKNWGPGLSAILASLAVFVIGVVFGYKDKKLSLRDFKNSIVDTGLSVVDIIMITAAAGIIIGVLNISGLGFGLTMALVHFCQGNLVLLLLMAAVVSIILGMGMPTVGVYVLLATLVAPALVHLGIKPISANLFVLYFGMMSMLTPPVAIAAFAAATVAKTPAMKTGWASVRFGWTAYIIPFVFVGAPSLLLLNKNPRLTITSIICALIGVWAVTAAIVGYLHHKLNTFERLLIGSFGFILLITPAVYNKYIIYTNLLIFTGIVIYASTYYYKIKLLHKDKSS